MPNQIRNVLILGMSTLSLGLLLLFTVPQSGGDPDQSGVHPYATSRSNSCSSDSDAPRRRAFVAIQPPRILAFDPPGYPEFEFYDLLVPSFHGPYIY